VTKIRPKLRGPASGLTEDERGRIARLVDASFFWFGIIAAVFLAWILASEAFARGWAQSWFILVIYLVIAYLILPRLHTVLSRIYLPDYFIGRTRTREGILGDPVNLGLQGTEQQIHATMVAAGWTLADDLGLRANLRIVTSTITRRSYPQAPVSNLYLFGHPQAFCYQQEVDGSPGKRHHVRFWPTPDAWMLPGGYQTDWLAAGTFDRSVGLSVFTLQITHRIADDIDVERDHIVSSVTDAGVGARVEVIDNFSTGYHSRNGGGDAIVTDGDLPIIDLRAVIVPDVVMLADSRESLPAGGGGTVESGQGSGSSSTSGSRFGSSASQSSTAAALSRLVALQPREDAPATVPAALPAALPANSAAVDEADAGPTEPSAPDSSVTTVVTHAEPRPFDTVVGALLMVLRSISSVVTVITLMLSVKMLEQEATALLDNDEDIANVPFALGIGIGFLAIGTIAYLLLATAVYRGSNWARITTMTLSSLTIIGLATLYFLGQGGITLQTNLIGLAVDISILLALSGHEARDWARGRKRRGRRTA
jgi:hypothetical protein